MEYIIKARILVKEDSDKLFKQYEEEINQIKKFHIEQAEEVRNTVKQMQLEYNKKFEDFSNESKAELQNKLDKKMSESENKISQFTQDFHQSKDSIDVITHAASKIIEEVASIKVPQTKLKKYVG